MLVINQVSKANQMVEYQSDEDLVSSLKEGLRLCGEGLTPSVVDNDRCDLYVQDCDLEVPVMRKVNH